MKPASPPPRETKASVAQVAATIFFGLFAIGKENTWEKNGVTVTPLQVVVGALVGLIVVLIALISRGQGHGRAGQAVRVAGVPCGQRRGGHRRRSLADGDRDEHSDLEGLYVGFEHYIPVGDDPQAVAIASGVNSRAGSRRIAKFAFDYALAHGRKKVTIVHKANVLKALTGLFLDTAKELARQYDGQLIVDDRIVDACAMQPSAAIFEAVHGSAPDIAGKGIANPVSLLQAACLMLEHARLDPLASRVRAALHAVLVHDAVRTSRIYSHSAMG